MTLRSTVVRTEQLGELTVVAEGGALTGLYFSGHWYLPPAEAFGRRIEVEDDPLFVEARDQLVDYLTGRRTRFDLPVVTQGSAVEEQVWAILRTIPRGTTTTYGAIAEQLGDKALAQRVGQAVGHNPVSIVIPCHRVVGADGGLTGFAGGLDRKRFLLELEEPADVRAGRLF